MKIFLSRVRRQADGMIRSFVLCTLCSATLVLLSLSSLGRWLEREVGLGILYAIRGDLEAPDGAMIVGIDRASLAWLQRNIGSLEHLSNGLGDCFSPHAKKELLRARSVSQVPRSLYTCLVQRLNAHDTRLIVFDINFNADTPDDVLLAQEFARSQNVLLLELLERTEGNNVNRRLRPSAPLARAALQTVFFQTDGRALTGYPTFSRQFPELPAMPVEAWRRHTGGQMAEGFSLPSFQPIWLYGPAGTVPTVPINRVFEVEGHALPSDLSQVSVFVGASDLSNEAASDHFEVPLVLARSNLMGGVELAATAFLNLLHQQRLVSPPLPVHLAIMFFFAVAVLVASRHFGGRRAVGSVIAIAGVYSVTAVAAFVFARLWLPIAVPVIVATPIAVLSGFSARFTGARRVIERLAPRPYARELLIHPEIGRDDSHVEDATVMFADMVGSTRLAERLQGDSFRRVMNRYYSVTTATVEANDGMVVEYIGDGVLALFTNDAAGPDHATKACRAAQEIPRCLPCGQCLAHSGHIRNYRLRFGIHSGRVTTGPTGAEHRFSFKALGEPVIIAARLQEHGKTLQDNTADIILLTAETWRRARLPEKHFVPLGMVELRGRSQKVEIFRLAI